MNKEQKWCSIRLIITTMISLVFFGLAGWSNFGALGRVVISAGFCLVGVLIAKELLSKNDKKEDKLLSLNHQAVGVLQYINIVWLLNLRDLKIALMVIGLNVLVSFIINFKVSKDNRSNWSFLTIVVCLYLIGGKEFFMLVPAMVVYGVIPFIGNILSLATLAKKPELYGSSKRSKNVSNKTLCMGAACGVLVDTAIGASWICYAVMIKNGALGADYLFWLTAIFFPSIVILLSAYNYCENKDMKLVVAVENTDENLNSLSVTDEDLESMTEDELENLVVEKRDD